MYFDKSAKDVTLDEAATIAAVIQTPARLSPFVNPERTLARRNDYVLRRMAEEGFVTQQAAEEAANKPIVLRGQATTERPFAAYFVEDIRKNLEQRFGAAALYETGLQVQTTLDVELQRAAEHAVDRGLRRIDKRRSGYRKTKQTVSAANATPDTYNSPRWRQTVVAGDIVPAVVMSFPKTPVGSARIRIGAAEVDLPRAAFAWTRKTNAADLFAVGDIIEVVVGAVEKGRTRSSRSSRRRSSKARSWPSTTAPVRFARWSAASTSPAASSTAPRRPAGRWGRCSSRWSSRPPSTRGSRRNPCSSTNRCRTSPGRTSRPYRPSNYDRKFEGPVTLRHALEDSRNIPAVKALEAVGPQEVVGYAKRLGLTGNYPPYLSLALGSAESTLLEMTSAYSAFPSQGVRMTPFAVRSVSDREGTISRRTAPSRARRCAPTPRS